MELITNLLELMLKLTVIGMISIFWIILFLFACFLVSTFITKDNNLNEDNVSKGRKS